jgi:hypothetical protein
MKTNEYRKIQFERVEGVEESVYLPTIQINSVGGKTNHLNITWQELKAIKAILCEGVSND